jgi:tRNA A-37 threonylcarbamoyl transferase component Bud32
MKKCSTCGTLYSGDLCPKCMAGFAQKPTDPTAPAAAEELPLAPGQTFHGLEVLELLGRGGMGVVYKARQPALDRLVALKILPKKMALDPDFQNRFIREAKALGSLNHPNIVAVYDFGAEAGLFFFAMEFIDGVNVRQILRERKLTPEQALKIVPQLCDALEYAHGEGVVHRDIKPENIMLDRKGRVKIADFGLAKLVGHEAQAMLTMTNMVMGTPHYMAPEQVENPKAVDHRADIYSMGVVFYEMLTGELPIGRFEPPSKRVRVDVRLDEIVLKSLEKEPERRYQKAGEVKDAVGRATAVAGADSYSPTIVTPVPARKKRTRVPLAAAAVLASALLVVLVASLGRPPEPAAVAPPPPAAPPSVPEKADLTKVHFAGDERPGGWALARTDEVLHRNPLPAKTPEDIGRVVKILDNVGIKNTAPTEVEEAYIAIWGHISYVAFAAVRTPVAERLESSFLKLTKPHNRWTFRKGDLLVVSWAWRREERAAFHDLVGRLQKKLGLPQEPPEIPLENLKVAKGDLGSAWLLPDAPKPAFKDGLADFFRMEHPEKASVIELGIYRFEPQAAAARESDLRGGRSPGGTPWKDVIRAGRTVAALALVGEDLTGYVRFRGHVRQWMGLPEKTFDTIVLGPSELPKGFSFDRIETDTRTIVKDLGFAKVQASEVVRAWRATFKPQGAIVLLEVDDYRQRSEAQNELRPRGPAEGTDDWVFGVEGPDDETLDALENRMREKFGWERNRPRTIDILHARLKESELPPGLALGAGEASRGSYKAQITGPGFTIPYSVREANDLKQFPEYRRQAGPKPGDVLLIKDYVFVHLSGPEAAWGALDQLEEALRKKMRMDPPAATDFEIEPAELPKGAAYLERKDLGFAANPQEFKGAAEAQRGLRGRLGVDLSDLRSAWAAVVDPDETEVYVLEVPDADNAKDLAERLRKTVKAKRVAVIPKGPFVALVRSPREVEAPFRAIAEIVRAKLRVRGP